jgi:hypothetical protein
MLAMSVCHVNHCTLGASPIPVKHGATEGAYSFVLQLHPKLCLKWFDVACREAACCKRLQQQSRKFIAAEPIYEVLGTRSIEMTLILGQPSLGEAC